MRQLNFGATPGTLYFLLADHLGSTTNVLTSAGVSQSSQKYWPYGETRNPSGTLPTDKQFTGQQNELNIFDPAGSYYYRARFYSPLLGRFLSVDPVGGSEGEPQSANAYTYALNNPIRHTDPTGTCAPDIEGPGGCGIPDDYAHPLVVIRWLLDSGFTLAQIENLGACGWLLCADVPPTKIGEGYRQVPLFTCGDGLYGCWSVGDGVEALVSLGLDLIPGIGDIRAIHGCGGDAVCLGIALAAIGAPVPGDSKAVGMLLRANRAKGLAAEVESGILKNTRRINIPGRPGYRVPDQLLDDYKIISEVKAGRNVYLTAQIRDYIAWAEANGYRFQLIVGADTHVSSSVWEAVMEHKIQLCRLRC